MGPLPSAREWDSAGSYRALLEGLGPCEGGMCQGGAGLSWKPVQVAWSKQVQGNEEWMVGAATRLQGGGEGDPGAEAAWDLGGSRG